MTAYEMLSRHSTAGALRIAAFMFLGAVLQLIVLPLAVLLLVAERATGSLVTAVNNVPPMQMTAMVREEPL